MNDTQDVLARNEKTKLSSWIISSSNTTSDKTGGKGQNHEIYDLCKYVRAGRDESWEKLRQWLNWQKNNKKRFKEAAAYKGYFNVTPLHVIVMRHPPVDVVETLVKHAPETLRTKNDFGFLPLHSACSGGASLEVLNLLIQAYPESVDVETIDDRRKPSDCLKEALSHLDYNEFDNDFDKFHLASNKVHMLLLHNASAAGYSVHLVKLLLEAFPESCAITDENGMLPLHHACTSSNVSESVNIAMVLLDAYPESSNIKDNQGRTAWQLLKPMAANRDDYGMLPLHHQAACPRGLTVNSLKFLFKAYPESIALPDNWGMLPFHHACLNTASSIDVLMLFAKLYPESIEATR